MTAFMDELLTGATHAALVDAASCTPPVLAALRAARVPLIRVMDTATTNSGELPDSFRREELLHVLVLLKRPETLRAEQVAVKPAVTRQLVAVIGSGGAGTSTVAAVLCQGLARDGDTVLLADLCRHAAQAMLHDITGQIDGVMEIALAPETSVAGSFLPQVAVSSRGYALMLGMRQPLQWVALQGQRVAAVLAALTAGEGVVVCDLDPDLETEQQTGSVGVGDRHRLTHTVLTQAKVVVLVVDASLVGVLRGVERLVAIASHVADTVPIVVVINRQKKTDAARPSARFKAAFAALNRRAGQQRRHITVVTVPLFAADRCHLAVTGFPARLTNTLAAPVRAALWQHDA